MSESKIGKYAVRQYESPKFQRIAIDCACQDRDHRLYIDLDIYSDSGDISLCFYKDLFIYDREQYPIEYYSDCKNPVEFLDLLYANIVYRVKTLWARIKRSIQILFTGHSKFEGDFYIYDLEHIDEFIEALSYARNKMVEGQDKFDNKKKKEYEDSLNLKTYMGEF